MEFDFKITTWERVTVDAEQEQDVLDAIKRGEINSANDVFNYLANKGDMNVECQKLDGVEEEMTPEENGGFATIEVIDNCEVIFKNG